MEFLFFIIAIGWIVLSAAAKKKQQEAKAAAERERARQRAERLAAEEASREGPPLARAPIAPSVHPTIAVNTPAPAAQRLEPQRPRQAAPVVPAQKKAMAGTQMREAPVSQLKQAQGSRLTATQGTPLHVVQARSIGGHAHEETSLSGVGADCAPDQSRGSAPALSPSKTAAPVFGFSTDSLASAVVMSEILGPCVALRK